MILEAIRFYNKRNLLQNCHPDENVVYYLFIVTLLRLIAKCISGQKVSCIMLRLSIRNLGIVIEAYYNLKKILYNDSV